MESEVEPQYVAVEGEEEAGVEEEHVRLEAASRKRKQHPIEERVRIRQVNLNMSQVHYIRRVLMMHPDVYTCVNTLTALLLNKGLVFFTKKENEYQHMDSSIQNALELHWKPFCIKLIRTVLMAGVAAVQFERDNVLLGVPRVLDLDNARISFTIDDMHRRSYMIEEYREVSIPSDDPREPSRVTMDWVELENVVFIEHSPPRQDGAVDTKLAALVADVTAQRELADLYMMSQRFACIPPVVIAKTDKKEMTRAEYLAIARDAMQRKGGGGSGAGVTSASIFAQSALAPPQDPLLQQQQDEARIADELMRARDDEMRNFFNQQMPQAMYNEGSAQAATHYLHSQINAPFRLTQDPKNPRRQFLMLQNGWHMDRPIAVDPPHDMRSMQDHWQLIIAQTMGIPIEHWAGQKNTSYRADRTLVDSILQTTLTDWAKWTEPILLSLLDMIYAGTRLSIVMEETMRQFRKSQLAETAESASLKDVPSIQVRMGILAEYKRVDEFRVLKEAKEAGFWVNPDHPSPFLPGIDPLSIESGLMEQQIATILTEPDIDLRTRLLHQAIRTYAHISHQWAGPLGMSEQAVSGITIKKLFGNRRLRFGPTARKKKRDSSSSSSSTSGGGPPPPPSGPVPGQDGQNVFPRDGPSMFTDGKGPLVMGQAAAITAPLSNEGGRRQRNPYSSSDDEERQQGSERSDWGDSSSDSDYDPRGKQRKRRGRPRNVQSQGGAGGGGGDSLGLDTKHAAGGGSSSAARDDAWIQRRIDELHKKNGYTRREAERLAKKEAERYATLTEEQRRQEDIKNKRKKDQRRAVKQSALTRNELLDAFFPSDQTKARDVPSE